ncbi:MAG: flagellar hook-length control protein FliK [Caulobacteraceae bacterium]|nr:flagellar hook-length control protein FliK [Caulobacteraceae bacterium]
MDFAPEPVLDAFTPPPTRSAPRTPVADDNGQTFDDHLDAVSNEAPERPAPAKTEAKEVAPPVDAKPDSADDADAGDEIDPDVALLGGPLPPPAPPPMAAPVVVQIAASQPQAPHTDAAPEDGESEVAPVSAPQTPVAPAMDTEANADAEAATPATGDKKSNAEAKPATDAPQTQPAQQTAQANTQPVQQAAPQAKVAVEELPAGVQQAIAATISAAPQTTPQPTQRAAPKAATQTGETKVEPDARDAKTDAPAANAKPRAPAASAGNAFVEAAPALQTQTSSNADGSHVEQSSALTTASQASTHVQHVATDTGAQRAAPAAAQVGREIIRRFNGGSTNFELRLDPADLGRVEVRMEVTRDHRVTAVITADNPQALTELARNARDLEQQLQSAGLQLSDSGLSFDLRQGAQGGDGEQRNNSNARGEANASATPEQQAAPLARPIGMDRWRGVRVDLMV